MARGQLWFFAVGSPSASAAPALSRRLRSESWPQVPPPSALLAFPCGALCSQLRAPRPRRSGLLSPWRVAPPCRASNAAGSSGAPCGRGPAPCSGRVPPRSRGPHGARNVLVGRLPRVGTRLVPPRGWWWQQTQRDRSVSRADGSSLDLWLCRRVAVGMSGSCRSNSAPTSHRQGLSTCRARVCRS